MVEFKSSQQQLKYTMYGLLACMFSLSCVFFSPSTAPLVRDDNDAAIAGEGLAPSPEAGAATGMRARGTSKQESVEGRRDRRNGDS